MAGPVQECSTSTLERRCKQARDAGVDPETTVMGKGVPLKDELLLIPDGVMGDRRAAERIEEAFAWFGPNAVPEFDGLRKENIEVAKKAFRERQRRERSELGIPE